MEMFKCQRVVVLSSLLCSHVVVLLSLCFNYQYISKLTNYLNFENLLCLHVKGKTCRWSTLKTVILVNNTF